MRKSLEDTLDMVVRQGFRCIKTYYSAYYGINIAEVASRKGLSSVIGVTQFGQSWTEDQIQAAIQSCKSNQKVIAIYADNEGNNIGEIMRVKNKIKSAGCTIPFGTVQTIGDFLNNPNTVRIVDQLDWLGFNVSVC